MLCKKCNVIAIKVHIKHNLALITNMESIFIYFLHQTSLFRQFCNLFILYYNSVLKTK